MITVIKPKFVGGTRSRGLRRSSFIFACLAAITVTAACSSGSSGTTGSNQGEPQSECGKAAQVAYESAMAPPEFELPPAFDTTSMAGKKFAYVSIITNSIIQEKYDAFAAALDSVGAEAIYFDGKGRPDVITAAIQSAIAQKVSGIVADGIDAAALAGSAVDDANAAGIPVINTNAGDPSTPLPKGIAANIGPGIFKTGTLHADYALANTDCKLTALDVYTTAAKLTVDSAEGFDKEVKRLCPDDCKVIKLEFNAATYPTTIEPQIRTALQRDPDIDAIVLSSSDVTAPYVTAGVQAVNSDAMVLGAQGDGLVDAIKGTPLKADVVWPPSQTLGYYAADGIMRAALDQPLTVEVPVRLVDSTNWGEDPSISAQFPGSDQVPGDFKAVWGVQ